LLRWAWLDRSAGINAELWPDAVIGVPQPYGKDNPMKLSHLAVLAMCLSLCGLALAQSVATPKKHLLVLGEGIPARFRLA
jgi:hypothetical protein